MTFLYFVVGAAIQEEITFGLLQTTQAWQFPATLSFFGTSLSNAAIIVALLFGLIHLGVNPITADSCRSLEAGYGVRNIRLLESFDLRV
jgi:membrane protease YdiL (CAAX protease family)